MSYLMIVCLAALSTVLVSCHDESHYLGSEEDRYANGFYIDGVRTHIETAGFFYDEDLQGYNVFFSNIDENMASGILRDVASRHYLSIDMPASKEGSRHKLNSSFNNNASDRYKFHLVTDHVPGFVRIQTGLDHIVDGYIELTVSKEWIDSYHKNIKFRMEAKIDNGRKIECDYTGKAQICKTYIGWWREDSE